MADVKNTHKMGPNTLNHGNQQCVYCKATDLEITHALGPLCPSAPLPGTPDAFKAYVHERLDAAGIPTHPNGVHSQAGCRVGDRLDILIAQRDATSADEVKPGANIPDVWTREELKDLISDAITNSIDMDWNSGIGAESVLDALAKEGLVIVHHSAVS
jgi:hypothetical protein